MNADKRIEEVSLNAWPSLQTLVDDGWLIRFANGYTKRANSINPIYHAQIDPEEKIDRCEQLHREKRLPTVFKITPFVNPDDLDTILNRRGYQLTGYTSVQRLSLDQPVIPTAESVRFSDRFDQGWLEDYSRLNNVKNTEQSALKSILSNIIPSRCFASLVEDGRTIGCGLGVLEDGLFGLFDIVVDAEQCRQGYGEQLILNMLQAGQAMGGTHAYLQVMLDNAPALKLYSKLGFEEVYQYWYRVKEL